MHANIRNILWPATVGFGWFDLRRWNAWKLEKIRLKSWKLLKIWRNSRHDPKSVSEERHLVWQSVSKNLCPIHLHTEKMFQSSIAQNSYLLGIIQWSQDWIGRLNSIISSSHLVSLTKPRQIQIILIETSWSTIKTVNILRHNPKIKSVITASSWPRHPKSKPTEPQWRCSQAHCEKFLAN